MALTSSSSTSSVTSTASPSAFSLTATIEIEYPINLWQKLRETLETNLGQLRDALQDNDGVYWPDELLDLDFIKLRLVDGAQSIENKIESIFRLAIEESGEDCLTRQVDEFLDVLLDELDAINWLLLRIPLKCGEHLWKLYLARVERVFEIIAGLERIYWAIRRGHGQMPRHRDYSMSYLFKGLPTSALEDALKRWDGHIDQLREACEALKLILRNSHRIINNSAESVSPLLPSVLMSSPPQEEEETVLFYNSESEGIPLRFRSRWFNLPLNQEISSSDEPEAEEDFIRERRNSEFSSNDLDLIQQFLPVIKLMHTIFKKIKLRYISCINTESALDSGPGTDPLSPKPHSSTRRIYLDDLLDLAEGICLQVNEIQSKLLLPNSNRPLLCDQLGWMVTRCQQLIVQVKSELSVSSCTAAGSIDHCRWFDLASSQLETYLIPITAYNPVR